MDKTIRPIGLEDHEKITVVTCYKAICDRCLQEGHTSSLELEEFIEDLYGYGWSITDTDKLLCEYCTEKAKKEVTGNEQKTT